ncbi:hypothetical protein H4R19_002148 [Coemansia spiralis]|nr:hypothetical protein H4R19_002148 [Coemansia spiralis]
MSAIPGAPASAAAAVLGVPANASAPYATGRGIQYRQASRKKLLIYPEVAPPPPPLVQQQEQQQQQRPTMPVPLSAFGPHPYLPSAVTSPTAVGTGTAFWDPEIAPATHYYPVHPAASPQYFAPPGGSTAEPVYPPPRPGYSRPGNQTARPQHHMPGPLPYVRPPAFPGGLYPQSAPISPAAGAHVMGLRLPHTLNMGDGAGYFSPTSAPAPPPLTAFGSGQPIPPPPPPPPQQQQMAEVGPQTIMPSSRPLGSRTYSPIHSQRQHYPAHAPLPQPPPLLPQQLQIAYLRNKDRQCDRTSFNTLYHCLRPVDLADKGTHLAADNRERHRGNLFPLFKVSEDWVAPSKFHPTHLPVCRTSVCRACIYEVPGCKLPCIVQSQICWPPSSLSLASCVGLQRACPMCLIIDCSGHPTR